MSESKNIKNYIIKNFKKLKIYYKNTQKTKFQNIKNVIKEAPNQKIQKTYYIQNLKILGMTFSKISKLTRDSKITKNKKCQSHVRRP